MNKTDTAGEKGLLDWPDSGMKRAFELLSVNNDRRLNIIDVGAHRGETLAITMNKLKASEISYIAIEANPETYKKLQEASHSHSNAGNEVVCINAAAGPKVGTTKFFSTKASAVAGVLPPASGLSERVPTGDHSVLAEISIPMTTIDFLVNKHKLDKVDLLKVDAEGFDLEVLKGAEQSLKSGTINAVLSEVFFVTYREQQAYFWDIAAYLHSFEYMFVNLFDTRDTSQGRIYTGNGLWVSKKLGAILNYL